MRKQRIVTRNFPANFCAQSFQVDRGNDQIRAAAKMLLHGPGDLDSGGKVNIAIGNVDRRAVKMSAPQGREFGSG